jgi:hypothetical protein
MSYRKVSGAVAATVTALALSASAYGDGKSPNGPPGPEGNPNQPAAAQPQANAPHGPAGNAQGKKNAAKSHGKSQAQSHGKSGQSHGKSQQSHGKSQAQSNTKPAQSHANPNVGTPRKGGREDRPAGKITICHATKSTTNPYVEITISVNGLHGHGPADDPHHHDGSWKDIIPAPAEGCPTTVTPEQQAQQPETKNEQQQPTTVTNIVAPTPEVAVTAPATAAAPATETAPGQQAVLGARAQGTSPAEDEAAEAPDQSKVLGAEASGTAPKAAVAAHAEGDDSGSLPFTGFELAFVLLVAAAALLGGFALRRATLGSRS